MGELSDAKLRATKPKERPFKLSDGAGLYVRIYPSGRKVFAYRYKVGSAERWLELGEYGAAKEGKLSLAEARTKAEQARVMRRDGVDPIDNRESQIREQQAKTAAEKAEITVKELVESYYERQILPHFKRPQEWRRIVDSYILPHIASLKVKDVHRSHLSDILNAILDRGARVMANRTLPVIKNLFLYAVERGHLEESPAALLSRKSCGGKEKPKERALTQEEMRAFWELLHDEPRFGASWQVSAVLKALLFTGQRVGEVLLARWQHLDLDSGVWRIPAENSKNGKAHLVHLPLQCIALFESLKPLSDGQGYVFPSDRDQRKPVTVRAVSEALLRIFERGLLNIDPFTPHDLRRTVVTHMAGLGIAPHIVEKIVNHSMTGVMAVYNRQEYLPERKEAMHKWGEYFDRIIMDQTNVVPLKKMA